MGGILMNKYKTALHKELTNLGKLKNTIFTGQQVFKGGGYFYQLLSNVSDSKIIELGVAEELQLGMSLGMSLQGYLPISIFQRMDFLPRAADQLINHLDLTKEHSRGMFTSKVIILSSVGTNTPFNVGLQHNKNLCKGFRHLLRNIPIYDLKTPKSIRNSFKKAIKSNESSILVARQDLF